MADLRRITQEMMDAIAPGRADVWRSYLHDRVVYVDEAGAVRGKEEVLRELTPLPKPRHRGRSSNHGRGW